MTCRQTVPQQWLIVHERLGEALWPALRRAPRGTGVIVLSDLDAKERRRLRHLAKLRDFAIVAGPCATRVHNMRELRIALLRRFAIILISPMHKTRSHPERQPLPRMRAAAMARLAGRRALALGGMDQPRFAKIAPLGFVGWAGIDAFRT